MSTHLNATSCAGDFYFGFNLVTPCDPPFHSSPRKLPFCGLFCSLPLFRMWCGFLGCQLGATSVLQLQLQLHPFGPTFVARRQSKRRDTHTHIIYTFKRATCRHVEFFSVYFSLPRICASHFMNSFPFIYAWCVSQRGGKRQLAEAVIKLNCLLSGGLQSGWVEGWLFIRTSG